MDDPRTDDNDQPTDDQATDDQATDNQPAAGADDGSRLDELGDKIQSVRAEADDVVEGVADEDDEDDERFADSGDATSAADDDQTIAPPG